MTIFSDFHDIKPNFKIPLFSLNGNTSPDFPVVVATLYNFSLIFKLWYPKLTSVSVGIFLYKSG